MAFNDWLVQQLRVSLFSDGPFPVSESVWKLLTGQEEAENRVSVPGGRQYSGKLLDGLLALTFTINRIDIVLAFDPTRPLQFPDVSPLPVVGKWTDLSGPFTAAVEPLLGATTAPVTRLAFGANLLDVASSREQTYKNLAKMLQSVKVDVKNMRELIFRINWPQRSAVVPDLEINRITAWTSLAITTNLMQAALNGTILSQNSSQVVHALSLEIDHNTSADRKDRFENRDLIPIFRELVTLADENASGGERP